MSLRTSFSPRPRCLEGCWLTAKKGCHLRCQAFPLTIDHEHIKCPLPLIGIIKCLVALGLAEGLRTMLSIPSGPFDHPSAWGPVLGWLIIVFALISLMDRIVCFFRRIPDAKPDVYTLALAEVNAERLHQRRVTREPHLP